MPRKTNPHGLTDRQYAFVRAYCGPYKFNGTKAAIVAGYSEDTAAEISSENLKKPKINMAIQDLLQERAFEYEELTRQIVAEYTKIAFADYTKLADFNGIMARFKSTDDVPDDIKACIKKVKVSDSGVEVELYSKEKALADLAKITGMFVNQSETRVTIQDALSERDRQILDKVLGK